MNITANRVRKARLKKNWSQGQLAVQAKQHAPPGSEIARATISRLENGHHEPTGWLLNALAMALGVSVDYLMGRTDEEEVGAITNSVPIPEPDLYDVVRQLNNLPRESREAMTKIVAEVVNLIGSGLHISQLSEAERRDLEALRSLPRAEQMRIKQYHLQLLAEAEQRRAAGQTPTADEDPGAIAANGG